ncbi:MAG TPA: cellulose-binding protein, partial [Propionibacteriaceae bacterium]|nr:cellulose-binding protein [Propionibacteriaceae bacterium]
AAKQRAAAEAAAALKASREEAASLVEQARATADRIRRDSERELAAATSRRDAITAQLTNVRQMLGTLGGGAAAVQLAEAPVEKAKPKAKAAQSADEVPTEQPADDQAHNEQG